jgi:hypothetical protein
MGDSRLQQSLGGQLPHRCHARAPEASPSHRRESPVSGGFRVSTASDGRGSPERKRSRSRPLTCRRESPERRRLAWLGTTAGLGSTRRATSRREAGIMTLVRCAPPRRQDKTKRRRYGGGRRRFGWRDDDRREEEGDLPVIDTIQLRRPPGRGGAGFSASEWPGCGCVRVAVRRAEARRDPGRSTLPVTRAGSRAGPFRSIPWWPSASAVSRECQAAHRIAIVRRSAVRCDG